MNSKLSEAARDGNLNLLTEIANGDTLLSTTPPKNTALHIAAMQGHHEFAQQILVKCPSLLWQANAEGDTALHYAARAGNLEMVKLLLGQHKQSREQKAGDEESQLPIESTLWRQRNWKNETALHEALWNKHTEVGLHLLEFDHEMAQLVNDLHESPLYLAAQHGLLQVVEKIVSGEPSSFSQEGPCGRTPLHAATTENYSDIVELLLEKTPTLITRVDSSGKTALHYAAQQNLINILTLLLEKDRMLGYVPDNAGFSPLLAAAWEGKSHAVDELLNYCPDSAVLLDPSGKNALHLAVTNNHIYTVYVFSRRAVVRVLINGRDKEGNTPLQLACKFTHLRCAVLLSRVESVVLNVKNKDGFTEATGLFSAKQDVISAYLMCCGASLPIYGRHRISDKEQLKVELKAMAENLAVVATLVALVSFATFYQMPGGYQTDEGMPLLLSSKSGFRNTCFAVFLLSDLFAAVTSTLAVLNLVYGMFGNTSYLRISVERGGLLTLFAILMVSVALFFAMFAMLPVKLVAYLPIVFVPIYVPYFFSTKHVQGQHPENKITRVVGAITEEPHQLELE